MYIKTDEPNSYVHIDDMMGPIYTRLCAGGCGNNCCNHYWRGSLWIYMRTYGDTSLTSYEEQKYNGDYKNHILQRVFFWQDTSCGGGVDNFNSGWSANLAGWKWDGQAKCEYT